MSGQLKANIAIETASETSLPLLLEVHLPLVPFGDPAHLHPPTIALQDPPPPPPHSAYHHTLPHQVITIPHHTSHDTPGNSRTGLSKAASQSWCWGFKHQQNPPPQQPRHTTRQLPGGQYVSFSKICEKTVPNPTIKIVVLSIGINNKDQDPRQTSCKQLKSLYKQAQLAFPNADIYFPIINFSDNLSIKQQYNLKYINNTIATYFPFLAEIPMIPF